MNIIITGASKGIGRETAIILARSAENRIIVIARSENLLISLSEASANKNIIPVAIDLNEMHGSPEKLLKRVSGHFDHIDILLNNAGSIVRKPFHELSNDEISSMVHTNFISPMNLIKILLPLFRKGSHVVNIGSMSGYQGSSKFPGLTVYGAAKAAIASITEALSVEYSDRGISFNCLAPGAVNTEMLLAAFPGYKAPLEASEMGDFIAWFLENGNKYFNGKVLPVSINNPG